MSRILTKLRRAVALAAVIVLAPFGATTASPQPLVNGFMYTVKFTCVAEVGPAESTDVEGPFLGALYRTAVNIHNPHSFRVKFTKKAVVSRSQAAPRGIISEKKTDFLESDQALDIDCKDVVTLLGGPQPVGNGFVVIETQFELDVVAVYTQIFIDKEIVGAKNVVHSGQILDQPRFEEFFRVFNVDPETGIVKPRERDREHPQLPPPGEPGNPGFPIVLTPVQLGQGGAVWGAGLGIGLGVGAGAGIDVEYIRPRLIRRGRIVSTLELLDR